MKEGAEKPDFCNGHSPAVTITFVCPSERREVSDLSLSDFKDVILSQTCPKGRGSVFETWGWVPGRVAHWRDLGLSVGNSF